MDEVMKALGDPKPTEKPSDSLLDEKSPLIETSSPSFGINRSTFDNVALATEEDLCDEEEEEQPRLDVDEEEAGMGSCLKDSGIVETSFASLEISDYSKLSEDSPSSSTSGRVKEEEEVKRRRPKLKLVSHSFSCITPNTMLGCVCSGNGMEWSGTIGWVLFTVAVSHS